MSDVYDDAKNWVQLGVHVSLSARLVHLGDNNKRTIIITGQHGFSDVLSIHVRPDDALALAHDITSALAQLDRDGADS